MMTLHGLEVRPHGPGLPAAAILDIGGQWLRRLAEWSAYGAAIVLMACVAMTSADILLRNLANSGFAGVVELTQLALLWSAFLSIPMGFVLDNHIAVDLVFGSLHARAQAVIRCLGAVAGVVFMVACAVWAGQQAAMEAEIGDRSQLLGIPMLLYWLPLIYGTALSAICALLTAVRAGVDVCQPARGQPARGQPTRGETP